MKRVCVLLSILVLPICAVPALAQSVQPLPPMSVITFEPGTTQTKMNGQMVPGGRDLYYVLAKAGQSLNVSVAPATAGIAFQVYGTDTVIARAADGSPLVQGKTLPNAGPNDNAQAWIGAIPRDGNYLITVGAADTGGPVALTPYTLTVSLQ